MTAFRYEAVDAAGRRKRGVITAETQRRARKEIQTAGLTPLSIKSVGDKARAAKAGVLDRPRNPKAADVIGATRQLATLIDASTTVEEALAAVASQMKGSPMADILLAVRARIIEGWRLSDAMGEHPKVFSELYRGIIAAGESSGNLGPVMLRLADMVEKNRAMAMKALSAMIYPAAIVIVSLVVVGALMNVVVPKIVDQFASSGADLPLLTVIVIAASDFVRGYGLLILLLFVAAGVGVWQARKRPGPRKAMDRALLRVPLIGGLLRDLDAARFSRTLATLFSSGAPLLDSLKAARRTVTNAYIKDRLEVTLTSVREGASLSVGMRRADVFPPMMSSMVAAGERSGAVPQLLEKTASHMEEGFDNAVTVALRLLEPLVIILLGGVVLVIVMAIMMPILQINTLAL